MRDAHGRVGGVHGLPAGPAGTEYVDAKIFVFDLQIDFFCFRQNGDGRSGRVNSPLRFGGRDALHSMDTALAAHFAERARALDLENRFLHAAELCVGEREEFDLPPFALHVARVHAEEFTGEERGFVATGTRADLDDGVAIVVERIVREEERLEFFFELHDGGREAAELGLRLGGHLGVVNADEELADFRELVIVPVERCRLFYDLNEPLVLATQRRHESGIADRFRVEQLPFDFRRACDRVGEEVPEAQAFAG